MITRPFSKRNLDAYSNFLQSKYEMYTGAGHVKSLPYYLCVDPSEICQLRCPTCPTGQENESKRKKSLPMISFRDQRVKMKPDLFDSLIDELGDKLFHLMLYNFGEPLLNQHIARFIRKAKAFDIQTEVHSNLSLKLSDDQIDELVSSGLDYLICSADGFSQETYEVHRVGGNLELVKRNLERLAAARDRLGLDIQIVYKFLIFSHNEHEIGPAAQYCQSIGVQFLPAPAMIHDPTWLPSDRKSEAPYLSQEQIDAMAAEWQAAGRGDYFMEHELHPIWNVDPEGPDLPACGWHYGYSVISSGGTVSPCCATAKQQDDFGLIQPGTVGFADIWNNDSFSRSRASRVRDDDGQLPAAETLCSRCFFPKFVRHVYSFHDPKVIDQYRNAHGNTDPAMARAFDLLAEDLNGSNPQPFVEHYERHFSGNPVSAVSDGR